MKISSKISLAAIILLCLISFVFFRAFARFGEFTTLVPRFDGSCEIKLDGQAGIEDFEIIENSSAHNQEDFLVYAAIDRENMKNNKELRGGIFATPINEMVQSNDRSLGEPKNFQPIGIGILRAPTNILMVVNNYQGNSQVEIFQLDNDFIAHHMRSVKIDGANRLNDVVPISANSFYVTNESKIKEGSFGGFIANLLDTDKSGGIYYFDGEKSKEVYKGLSYANSVALSKDKSRLYATGTLSRNIVIFDRNTANNDLKLVDDVFLGTGVDNINIDNEGRLFIGAHPKIFTLLKKMWFGAKTSPNQVIVIEPNSGKGGKVDQVYLDKGDEKFSASSVAAKSGNKLIIGSIFSKGLKVCELPKVWHQSKAHPAQSLIDIERDAKIKKAQKELREGGGAK